ncbi:TPA: hypothetical protein ACH3X1_014221 [Trebouxia sp. C0004]
MAAAMAKIAKLEAANAGLEASAKKKDTALGTICTVSAEIPSSSGVVEDPVAVYAARLAQLAARRAKKGAKAKSSAPLPPLTHPDTELWDQLKDLKQGSLPVAQCVHKMQYCFNGINELPISAGEKLQRFMVGLNPTLNRLVVTAPFGMGRNGKWLDPNQLMSYTVTQAQGLPNGGAVGSATASPLVGQSGHKRFHDGNGIANAKGKKQKRKDVSKKAGFASGGKSKTTAPIRPNGEKPWLIEKRLCLHCCKPNQQSYECAKKRAGSYHCPSASHA